MNVDELFPSKSNSLKAEDLKGRAVTAIIKGYEVVDFGGSKKPVLSFQGKDKTLVLNKTNARAIAASFGQDLEGWKGKEIEIFPATTEFNGKTVPCLRVRVIISDGDFDDPIPF